MDLMIDKDTIKEETLTIEINDNSWTMPYKEFYQSQKLAIKVCQLLIEVYKDIECNRFDIKIGGRSIVQ